MRDSSKEIVDPVHFWISRQAWNAARLFLMPLGLLIGISPPAKLEAHSAPSGWDYPSQCCGERDCWPVHDGSVVEGPEGYVVRGTGETIDYRDPRVMPSPDGEIHLCLDADDIHPRLTTCLFVPPRAVMGLRRHQRQGEFRIDLYR
ncbi:hypothetical protein [Sinorhizobium fredii]|nr:hypothetical protein [Sinorhizobium fredii]